MSDLIDRRDAIDAAIEAADEWDGGMNPERAKIIGKAILNLPSAQPEKRTEERTETHARDLISRQAAIDAFDSTGELIVSGEANAQNVVNYINKVVGKIKDLPSAQPTPEEFEWCHDCKEYDSNSHCCHRWTKVIRQTVEELREGQTEPHWIPCSERLPEDRLYVLVTCKYEY